VQPPLKPRCSRTQEALLKIDATPLTLPIPESRRLWTLRTTKLDFALSTSCLFRGRSCRFNGILLPSSGITTGFAAGALGIVRGDRVRHGAKCARMESVLHHATDRSQLQIMPTESENTIKPAPSGNWGAIRISGADRRPFLQGQLTQDVNRLEPGAALLAGWASPKGRLLCVGWLFAWEDEDWLVLPAELADPIAKRLRMFVLRSAVNIEPANAGVHPVAQQDLPPIFNSISNKKDINYCLIIDNKAIIEPANLADMALLISRADPPEPGSPKLANAWRLAMIDAGLPSVWPATREEFVPQMLNLDLLDGISFRKGCYVGQEIVARTQNLGRIKRRMYAFSAPADADAAAGSPVYSGNQTVGQVVDAIAGPNDVRLLAVIRIDNSADALSLDSEGECRLKPRPLPYTLPETPAA
jgi:folate-binding protein YgfZ